jgi:hypothetical protein
MIATHKNVTLLAIDIFFVNKIPFFGTLSWNICFTAVTHLSNCTLWMIFAAFQGIYNYYYTRGFRITTVMADGYFAALYHLRLHWRNGAMIRSLLPRWKQSNYIGVQPVHWNT